MQPAGINPAMEASGFEPPNSERAVLQTAAFSHFARPPKRYLIIITDHLVKSKQKIKKVEKNPTFLFYNVSILIEQYVS